MLLHQEIVLKKEKMLLREYVNKGYGIKSKWLFTFCKIGVDKQSTQYDLWASF